MTAPKKEKEKEKEKEKKKKKKKKQDALIRKKTRGASTRTFFVAIDLVSEETKIGSPIYPAFIWDFPEKKRIC